MRLVLLLDVSVAAEPDMPLPLEVAPLVVLVLLDDGLEVVPEVLV